jgi:hypothetical protein
VQIERQRSVSDADQQPLAVGESEGVRVVAMCTFEAVQDYELGFRQYDVLTAIAKAEEVNPSLCVSCSSISFLSHFINMEADAALANSGPIVVGRADWRQDWTLSLRMCGDSQGLPRSAALVQDLSKR